MSEDQKREVANMRKCLIRGVLYLRAEDVAEYLRIIGATEETDVRNRLDEAARNLLRFK